MGYEKRVGGMGGMGVGQRGKERKRRWEKGRVKIRSTIADMSAVPVIRLITEYHGIVTLRSRLDLPHLSEQIIYGGQARVV